MSMPRPICSKKHQSNVPSLNASLIAFGWRLALSAGCNVADTNRLSSPGSAACPSLVVECGDADEFLPPLWIFAEVFDTLRQRSDGQTDDLALSLPEDYHRTSLSVDRSVAVWSRIFVIKWCIEPGLRNTIHSTNNLTRVEMLDFAFRVVTPKFLAAGLLVYHKHLIAWDALWSFAGDFFLYKV
jgi:hypothetical protein